MVRAEDVDQFVVDDLDDLLAGGSEVSTSCPIAFSLTALDERLTTWKWTSASSSATRISLQGGLHVLGRQFAFAAQVLEDPLQLVA